MTLRQRLARPLVWQLIAALLAASTLVFATLWMLLRERAGTAGAPSPPARAAPETAAPETAAPETAHDEHAAHRVADRTSVTVAADWLPAIGVRIAAVERSSVTRPIRAVATVAADESRVSHVHTRVAGWIEQLHVSTTGQRVRAGQPLADIFSQELLATQNEYLTLLASMPDEDLLRSARSRLEVLGMTRAGIERLARTRRARRTVTLVAPRSGVVLQRGISVGTAVDPATELMTVVDLSRVWVLAEIPASDAAQVRVGTPAVLHFPAAGRPDIETRVDFVYPTLSERTRTLRVRFVIPNPGLRLRPGLYGTAEIRVAPREVLTVPRDAVVDTGEAQHVFVATGPTRFTPRRVVLGARLGDRVEVLEGIEEGERIVASGVFLIDSESRLRASGGSAGHGGHGGG